ncbi:uncharacterized protein MONOS_3978 [Monocercomonoides exilis]|uniref:uncharacterized protein n=1 Tax=Monocercomonoides exilis TaxID=2049356 RepID=UPI003559C508|nr:hypothetical protein MONOS_3978 [Monocercomonoides exilis]|eukprot:MONOS_3978.1-p1 / transcript=MONOS_3978.1 / gene=MONOS_3978 / organism=Monocercomonoides_exilis_PA203 / gene_product=unspecified product / transcript_product=unspecified product / location=Mono_scaffold00099:125330-128167(+) / protein_length=922 / sequence_SO=supercontig / SO=protein_coding / is_pseudo=false
MAGGNLVVDGFVMESGVTQKMNEKSPIMMTSGVELEISNSRMSGVEVIGVDRGCGNGMKGGGMMISVGSGGILTVSGVNLSECEVPSEDAENGGRGMGGGMFAELANQMGTFSLESMTFSECNAWKGKNVFASGWNLIEIVNKEHLKWEMSEGELGSLDELCGWERKTTGEDGYVIPLVVYLWDNWSVNGFVSREKGGDFSGCGYSEAPCSSVDHLFSLRYGSLGEGESHINIVGSGLLQKAISFLSSSSSDTPVVKIEGETNGTVLRIEEEKEKDGENREAMVASEVILSFVNVSFVLPNVLVHHLAFIKSSSGDGALSVRSCSFVSEDASKETNFCLVRVDGGSVEIEDCALKEFHLLQGFMELSSDVKVADVMNLSISYTSVSGRSLISISESALLSVRSLKEATMLKNKVNVDEDGMLSMSVNSSSFTNITCNYNRAAIVSAYSFECEMRCLVEGCVMTKCLSEWSEEGGRMKVSLKSRGSELRVSGCQFGMCICSIVKGRGGGLMIDASGLGETQTDTVDAPFLGILIESTRFTMNDAFVGKDVFIRRKWIEKQINEKLFSLDFSQDALKSNNSICGSDEEKRDIDLIPLVTFYYGQQVFVEANGRDIRQCGEQTNPCKSISHGVSHIQKGIMNVIFIDGEGDIGGECVMGDVSVKPMKKVKATIRFNATVQEMGNEGAVIVFVNESVMEKCLFVFGEAFEGVEESALKEKDGRLEISDCFFSSSAMDFVMKSMILHVERGELKMSETSFSGIHSSVPLLSFCGELGVSIAETRISNIECEGEVVRVGGKAKAEMKEVMFENISVASGGSVMKMDGAERGLSVLNCSFAKCRSTNKKGKMMRICECVDMRVRLCVIDGEEGDEKEGKHGNENNGRGEEICRWDGSLVDVVKSSVLMKDTTISNSPEGGITISGENM